ncbi:hypothetical protein ACOMHN_058191 [Nucella lapillus]
MDPANDVTMATVSSHQPRLGTYHLARFRRVAGPDRPACCVIDVGRGAVKEIAVVPARWPFMAWRGGFSSGPVIGWPIKVSL